MTIDFACPECGAAIHAPDGSEGRNGNCLKCGARISVPEDTAYAPRRGTPRLRPSSPILEFEAQPKPSSPPPVPPDPGNGGRLTRCPDCGSTISIRAASCPHCGCPFAVAAVAKNSSTPIQGRFEYADALRRTISKGMTGAQPRAIIGIVLLVLAVVGYFVSSELYAGAAKQYLSSGSFLFDRGGGPDFTAARVVRFGGLALGGVGAILLSLAFLRKP